MSTRVIEVNFDGLVGPSHNYAGLSYGNLASTRHGGAISNPRAAALQGLEKMKWVSGQGVPQAILPPHARPNLAFLRSLGFQGTLTRVLESAWKEDPRLVAASYSASNMWTANAATISPSIDCQDGLLHLTPANLISGIHRAIEANETCRILTAIFADESRFHVHDPLPPSVHFGDEGAANHTRLCWEFGSPGLEFFVYGKDAYVPDQATSFPARQTKQASEAIARRHHLDPLNTVFAQQSRKAIDGGVFHNDVICVGHRNVLLVHETAFEDRNATIDHLSDRFHSLTGTDLCVLEILEEEVSLKDAVQTYLFNSQFIIDDQDQLSMICPQECMTNQVVKECLDRILTAPNPIDRVHFLNLRESMNNGGGPACLRLRVVMTPAERRIVHEGVWLTEERYEQLKVWIETHYREEIAPDDLRDPQLAAECERALDKLATIMLWPSGFLTK